MTTRDRGLYKQKIKQALYTDENIMDVLLSDTIISMPENNKKPDKIDWFNAVVKSHLFIDDTIDEQGTYIFFDVTTRKKSPYFNDCKIILYAVCSRDLLDNYNKDGYCGNRADILTQMIEDRLINNIKTANEFGIGELSLDSVDIYNAVDYYGYIMTFSVPDFK